MKIENELLQLKQTIINYRKVLHKIPEQGFKEYKTSQYIKKVLDELKIPYDSCAETGIVAYLKLDPEKKTIGFRADMDGLEMTEETNLDFKSTHEGYMHGCGHDGHMAMLLGLATYLAQNMKTLKYNVVFIFQPAEEGPGGAEIMIESGIIEKYGIDEIYGYHLYPEVEEGKIAVMAGPVMAMTGEFDIKITGRGGHGAMPHRSNDSIIIGAELISQFQSIVSRNVNPNDPAVLTIGKTYGGERRNIIAKEFIIEGTLRAFDREVYSLIKTRMQELSNAIEIAYNCKVNVEFRDMYPPVINDPTLSNRIKNNDEENIIVEIEPQMTAEDFSYFLEKVPGVFMFLGVKNDEKNHVFPLHNSKFTYNDQVLIYGVQMYLKLLGNEWS